jgi:hypothetical protein
LTISNGPNDASDSGVLWMVTAILIERKNEGERAAKLSQY